MIRTKSLFFQYILIPTITCPFALLFMIRVPFVISFIKALYANDGIILNHTIIAHKNNRIFRYNLPTNRPYSFDLLIHKYISQSSNQLFLSKWRWWWRCLTLIGNDQQKLHEIATSLWYSEWEIEEELDLLWGVEAWVNILLLHWNYYICIWME